VNRVILCIIDDVRSSHFFDLIKKGLLPNFKKLMENGIFSKRCVTDFPSVTYPTQCSIITGTYTGDYRHEMCHGVPAYHWMGRYLAPPFLRNYGAPGSDEFIQIYKMNADLGSNCQTLLEMTGEGNHASITQFISRGTDYIYPESKVKLGLYYEFLQFAMRNRKRAKGLMALANSIVVRKLIDSFKRPKKFFKSNEPPIGSNLWFMTSDVIMHLFGYDSYLYKLNLMHIDKVIGILVKELDEIGYLIDTAIAITADHGNYKAKSIGNILPFYGRTGLTNYHPKKNIKGNVNISEFGGVGMFNFKGSNDIGNDAYWGRPRIKELEKYGPKRLNMFEELFKIEGTSLMYFREDYDTYKKGTIHLKRKDEETGKIFSGKIEYKGIGKEFKTRYTSEDSENDVFGFMEDDKANKLVNGNFYSIDEWLDATHHLDHALYPDLIPRHFKNPRSSDIIISTKGSIVYNVTHGNPQKGHVFSHDIGLQESTILPLIIAGSPEIPQKEISYCKSTDITPTLIKMLGKKPHDSVVGKDLI